jgi:membrane protein DedA with SNARE-associated domain
MVGMEQAVLDFFHQIQTGQLTEFPNRVYLIIAVLTIFEGPLTTLTGAAAASMGLLNPGLVFLAASTGNLTGDFFWHSLGRVGKLNWFLRGKNRFGFDPARLEWFKHKLRDHAPKMIFLTKITSSFIVPALISTGLVKLSWRRWFPALLAAEILWTGSLIVIGYFSAGAISDITTAFKLLPFFGILFLFFFFVIRVTRHAAF